MASPMRLTKALQLIPPARQILRPERNLLRDHGRRSLMLGSYRHQRRLQQTVSFRDTSVCSLQKNKPLLYPCRPFATSYQLLKTKRAHNNETVPDGPPTTDFSRMDMLSQTPAPSTSVDICQSDGFRLNSGVSIHDGKGVVLLGGEAFEWQPWGPDMRLVNAKGQWEVPEAAFGMFDLVWPRPDLLVLGLGPSMRPLSPTTKKYLSSLGLRVEVLDTRNAASQFNMLATERGIEEVAAALIPIGWTEGIGANHYD